MRMAYSHIESMHYKIHTLQFTHLGCYLVWVFARTSNFGTCVITKNTKYFVFAICSNIRHAGIPSNRFTFASGL